MSLSITNLYVDLCLYLCGLCISRTLALEIDCRRKKTGWGSRRAGGREGGREMVCAGGEIKTGEERRQRRRRGQAAAFQMAYIYICIPNRTHIAIAVAS